MKFDRLIWASIIGLVIGGILTLTAWKTPSLVVSERMTIIVTVER